MAHQGSGTVLPSQGGLAAQERKGEHSGIIRHTGFADNMVKKSGERCVTDGLGIPVPTCLYFPPPPPAKWKSFFTHGYSQDALGPCYSHFLSMEASVS